MTPKAVNMLIDAVIARASDLRRAGITSMSVGDVSIVVGTPWHDPPTDARGLVVEGDAPPPPEPRDNPMQDAATYGGGRVPGFQKPKKE